MKIVVLLALPFSVGALIIAIMAMNKEAPLPQPQSQPIRTVAPVEITSLCKTALARMDYLVAEGATDLTPEVSITA